MEGLGRARDYNQVPGRIQARHDQRMHGQNLPAGRQFRRFFVDTRGFHCQ